MKTCTSRESKRDREREGVQTCSRRVLEKNQRGEERDIKRHRQRERYKKIIQACTGTDR